MAGIEIRVSGAGAAQGALRQVHERLEDAYPFYDEIGRMLAVSTQERFEREVSPAGSPWPQSLRAQFDGGKTLTDSGMLRNSITWEATRDQVAVGSNLIYAAIHQFGGTIRAVATAALRFMLPGIGWVMTQSVTIPARPFLGLDPEDEAAILEIAEEWLLAPVAGGARVH